MVTGGGPAATAGPRFFPILALWAASLAMSGAALGQDWIPPRPVTAIMPGATLAPGSTDTLDLVVFASGGSATLFWGATSAGQFPCTVSPASGGVVVPAGTFATIPLSVTLPPEALGISTLSIELTNASDGGFAAKVDAAIFAATGGRPEIRPVPGTRLAPAGTAGPVNFEIHSLSGAAEQIVLTTSRLNPDPNNQGLLFSGTPPASPVNLPAGATINVSVPTTIAANAYAGNLNEIKLQVTSDGGISTANGHAVTSTQGLVPTALRPIGVTPHETILTGRDGPALLPDRGYWLVPAGPGGVRVHRVTSTDSIGMVDAGGDGVEDRWIGTLATSPYAAAIAAIPRFVTAANETLDVGLVAAGSDGLVLFNLTSIEDPIFGTWQDSYDSDMNGIDDRILRTIPIAGFATDVAWFRASSGRYVALVAAADTGSDPVSLGFNPAAVTAGTGAGVVAIDVTSALDPGLPSYAAGTLATPGSVTDLELRSGGNASPGPDLAIADGASGIALYGLTASAGAPAAVTFNPRGTVALSSAWGAPYARDIAWVSNTKDSLYAAVAAGPGGLQIARLPLAGGGAPLLVWSQQTLAPAVGLGGAWTGTLAAAMGGSGAALFRAPLSAAMNQIATGAPAPYTAPVTLARGAAWGGTGSALEVGALQPFGSAATSLGFEDTTGPTPDLVVSDGSRLLTLRPGSSVVTSVEPSPPPAAAGAALRLSVAPNPIDRGAVFVVRAVAPTTASSGSFPGFGPTRIDIHDVRGRLVRRLHAAASTGGPARVAWDGRDRSGRVLPSGRYWARATLEPGGSASKGAGSAAGAAVVPILIVR
jgi:hypothetical protein